MDKRGLAECWPWTAGRAHAGHGVLSIRGSQIYAHRISWALTHGDPGTLHVCHHCDNPPCVNPAHLFLGTHQDNMADARKKRRWTALEGRSNPNNRLSPEQVVEIRALCADGMSQRAAARRFGVHPSTIGQIVNRVTWRYLDDRGHGPECTERGDTGDWGDEEDPQTLSTPGLTGCAAERHLRLSDSLGPLCRSGIPAIFASPKSPERRAAFAGSRRGGGETPALVAADIALDLYAAGRLNERVAMAIVAHAGRWSE